MRPVVLALSVLLVFGSTWQCESHYMWQFKILFSLFTLTYPTLKWVTGTTFRPASLPPLQCKIANRFGWLVGRGMVFACGKIKGASWGACEDYGAAIVGRVCLDLGWNGQGGSYSMCNTSPSVALFIHQCWSLLFSASLPLQLKDGSNNSLSLYDNTLLLRHPIKRISTSSGLTATPVAAGLIKGVSKCLIQRLMPPREL